MAAKSILHLLTTARMEGRGIASIVEAIASGLDPAKYESHAWFMDGNGPLAAEMAAAGSVRVDSLEAGHGSPATAVAFRFWRLLHRGRFALIHQHFNDRRTRLLVRSATRSPIVAHIHDWRLVAGEHRSVRIECADAVIATSRAVAEPVTYPAPVVVYPGVRVPPHLRDRTAEDAAGKALLGTAGRLAPVKGIPHLIRAMSLIHKDFPVTRLEIVGDGTERTNIENEIRRFGLQDTVTLLGWRTDLASVRKNWDIYVQPSIREAFGLAALEAAAVGIPVVASSVGGLPELVENGKTGWLVPPADPVALAERLRWMLLNGEERLTMGSAAHHRARTHFARERMIREISTVYDTVIGD